jgi:hypothetical protein
LSTCRLPNRDRSCLLLAPVLQLPRPVPAFDQLVSREWGWLLGAWPLPPLRPLRSPPGLSPLVARGDAEDAALVELSRGVAPRD